MKTYSYNTFRFFRHHFGLPARAAFEWCAVREITPAGCEMRLGVALKGTGLYIDVAMRRFFSQADCGGVSRRYFPAVRIDRKCIHTGLPTDWKSPGRNILSGRFTKPRISTGNFWKLRCCKVFKPYVRNWKQNIINDHLQQI